METILILGSKEYPFGSNGGEDPIPSGGMETYVDDLAPELSKLCKIIIVTRRFRGRENHETSGNIEILRVPWLKGRWFRNPTFNKMSFFYSLKPAGSADVIYSNGVVAGLTGLCLGRIKKKRTVYRPAGTAFLQQGFPLRQILFFTEKLVMKRSDAVVFHSDGEKRNAQKFFSLDLDNGHVILTGFPVEKFANTSSGEPADEKGIVISAIARFVPVKGLEVLLEACSMLESDFGLLMVGSGPEEEKLKKLAEELGIADKVKFMGFRHDVPEILSNSQVFVISSFSEGLPTSLLEAMAAGNACVVTDIGLPVEHMKTGLIVNPGDPRALLKALEILAKDPGLRKRLGASARKFVLDNCTQKMAAEKHKKLFESLLK